MLHALCRVPAAVVLLALTLSGSAARAERIRSTDEFCLRPILKKPIEDCWETPEESGSKPDEVTILPWPLPGEETTTEVKKCDLREWLQHICPPIRKGCVPGEENQESGTLEPTEAFTTTTAQTVPEPSTLVLVGIGTVGMWLHRRRRSGAGHSRW